MNQNSNIYYIYFLSLTALVILSLATSNMINLSTAISYTRAREIGMKKVFGGTPTNFIFQFLGETFFHTAIALILAILLVEVLLPFFNLFTDKAISHSFIITDYSPAVIGSLLLLIGLLAGIYPAFCLSGYQPIDLFKSKSTAKRKSLNPRKILVASQFTISTCLIIATILAFAQLQHLKNATLGFEKDRIIVFKNAGNLTSHYYAFKKELLQHPGIESVTGMEDLLGVNHNTRAYQVEGLEEGKNYYYPTFLVEWDFIQTFQIRMLEGRAFSPDFPGDLTQSVVINQTMAQSLGWSNHEALGKSIQSQYGQEKVIGVCADFYVLSLHHPKNKFIIDMYTLPEEFARIIAVRVKDAKTTGALSHTEKVWNRYNPTRPFAPQMLKEHLDEQYANEARFGRFFLLLTILALLIACIGLIGLASFLAEQKNRELCLRKVHGASLNNLLGLMFKAFLGMLIFSNLIAWPLTWFIAEKWLGSYASQTPLSLWVYISASAISVLILTVIIFIRTRFSYKKNPADVLKYHG